MNLKTLIFKKSGIHLQLNFINKTIAKFNELTSQQFNTQLPINQANYIFDEFLISNIDEIVEHPPQLKNLIIKRFNSTLFPVKQPPQIPIPLPCFVCQILDCEIQNFILQKTLQQTQISAKIDSKISFPLLLNNPIHTDFLLPGSKILITSSKFYGNFVDVVEFIPLGGTILSQIDEILTSKSDEIRNFYIRIQNEKVAQVLSLGQGFAEVQKIWKNEQKACVQIGRVGLGSVWKE